MFGDVKISLIGKHYSFVLKKNIYEYGMEIIYIDDYDEYQKEIILFLIQNLNKELIYKIKSKVIGVEFSISLLNKNNVLWYKYNNNLKDNILKDKDSSNNLKTIFLLMLPKPISNTNNLIYVGDNDKLLVSDIYFNENYFSKEIKDIIYKNIQNIKWSCNNLDYVKYIQWNKKLNFKF